MDLKQCIATGIRNINNSWDGNVFKECNIIVLPLLQLKGKQTHRSSRHAQGKLLHLPQQPGMCNKCCTNHGKPVPT